MQFLPGLVRDITGALVKQGKQVNRSLVIGQRASQGLAIYRDGLQRSFVFGRDAVIT
jgi:hypothetical protein